MTADEIINNYDRTGSLDEIQFAIILEEYRVEAIDEIRKTPNRKFALDLLNHVIESRQKENYEIGTGDNLMFASYLLGLHNQVEDCLQIWKAKSVDFDSYCYVDIQLVVFAGVDETLNYLKNIKTEEASRANEHVKGCQKSGDFNDLDNYFSNEHLPWWI